MSGHSKWSNIKRKKEKADFAKAKIFTKIGRDLAIAVKEGGSADPASNFKLRDCIQKAKACNVPNENIERIIKKAAKNNSELIIYEGYGPGGVAVLIECFTDNRNRTAGDMRHYFDKCGGNLGNPGCVSFLFEKKGTIIIKKELVKDFDSLFLFAVENGAEDVITEDDYIEVLTSREDLNKIKDLISQSGYEMELSDVQMFPKNKVNLKDEDLEKFDKLLELLEENEDVQNVYHNCLIK